MFKYLFRRSSKEKIFLLQGDTFNYDKHLNDINYHSSMNLQLESQCSLCFS